MTIFLIFVWINSVNHIDVTLYQLAFSILSFYVAAIGTFKYLFRTDSRRCTCVSDTPCMDTFPIFHLCHQLLWQWLCWTDRPSLIALQDDYFLLWHAVMFQVNKLALITAVQQCPWQCCSLWSRALHDSFFYSERMSLELFGAQGATFLSLTVQETKHRQVWHLHSADNMSHYTYTLLSKRATFY